MVEINGYLKNKCGKVYYQCVNDPYTFYRIEDYFYSPTPTSHCGNDPHDYQACGFVDPDSYRGGKALCGIFDDQITIAKRITVACDGICDEELFCKNEEYCNGYHYGLRCGERYLPVHDVCIFTACVDIRGCDASDLEGVDTCIHSDIKITVPIFNYTRCGSLRYSTMKGYCDDFSDQLKCDDPQRVAGVCQRNDTTVTVSVHVECLGLSRGLCDDNIHLECKQISRDCRNIHKHRMCNNVTDCTDSADETTIVCSNKSTRRCQRKFGLRNVSLYIPISWLHDGVEDCENGIDELDGWEKCGASNAVYNSIRYNYYNSTCENVLICGKNDYIELDELCDGKTSCRFEDAICSGYQRDTSGLRMNSTRIVRPTSDDIELRHIAHCIPGLNDPLFHECYRRTLDIHNTQFFGITQPSFIIPENKLQCQYTFGECYVYLSCSEKCEDQITCPVTESNIPTYRSCEGQYLSIQQDLEL